MVRWDLDSLTFNQEIRDEHQELYRKALDAWGQDAQINMAFEECGELIVALCHARRDLKDISREEIVGEIIDVSLMLEQLCHILNVSSAEWCSEREKKLASLRKLLT